MVKLSAEMMMDLIGQIKKCDDLCRMHECVISYPFIFTFIIVLNWSFLRTILSNRNDL